MTNIKVGDKVKILWTKSKLCNEMDYQGNVDKGEIHEVGAVAGRTYLGVKSETEKMSCWIPWEAVELVPVISTKESLRNTKFRVNKKDAPSVLAYLKDLGFSVLRLPDTINMFLYIYENTVSWTHINEPLYFTEHSHKEIDIKPLLSSQEPPLSEWVPELIKAGLEGKEVYYGDSESKAFQEAINTLKTRLDKKEFYTIHDPKDEVREEIVKLQNKIKELEGQL